MRSIKISKQASHEIDTIWEYTKEHWSEQQADYYHALLWQEFRSIRDNPETGKSYDGVIKGLRSTKVKSHLIFYKTSKKSIFIFRILHERMDIINRLHE